MEIGDRNGRKGLWRLLLKPYDRVDQNIGSIKMKIPPFQGKNESKLYVEWKKMMEHIFEWHNYIEMKNIKFVVIEFIDYELNYWDQLMVGRRRNHEKKLEEEPWKTS